MTIKDGFIGGWFELRMQAREHSIEARKYRASARRCLPFLKTATKGQRLYILECYVGDLKKARKHSTIARSMYACAHTWPKEAR